MVARALIVTITEGVGLLPQAAFLSSALRELGFEPRLLATDFCTTQDGFQTAVKQASPSAVFFIDALEWREILVTLSGFACEATSNPVLISTFLPGGTPPAGFPERVKFVADGDTTLLAEAAGVRAKAVPQSRIPLDYRLFGGAAVLDRAMAASLFGDVGTVALLATRGELDSASHTAALARLEGACLGGPIALTEDAALGPLQECGAAVHRVEWWDRSFFQTCHGLLEAVWRMGLRQSVRLSPHVARTRDLDELKRFGVSRIVFESSDLDEEAVAAAAAHVRAAGLEAGVLFVIGLPGETAAHTRARCDELRAAGIDRVRVVPFEPTGESGTWDWCVAKEWWPPKNNRWNRELYQPLEQAEAAEYPKVLEEALMLVADIEIRCGART